MITETNNNSKTRKTQMLPDSSDSVQTKKNYNQRVLFEEPAGKCRETIAQPQTEDCRKFCSEP